MALQSPSMKCELSEWGLPPLIVAWFRKKGITSLFEWQVECLCQGDVLYGGNLVYSAPTSAGKTLVADFLMLKRVLEYGKKALVIEPFVALTREKAASLKSMLFTTKARVGAFGGSYYTPGGLTAVSVAVCTIEKANNFVNKLINESKLGDIGIIVVDEIHYLGDERRGHLLELLLTKVLFHNSKVDKSKRIQIVGLSATIPNLKAIASWLKASLYVSIYRPIPLEEKIKFGDKIYDVQKFLQDPDCPPLETIIPSKFAIEKDFDDLFYICMQTTINGHSALVFCESKRECEIMAMGLADQIKISGNLLNHTDQDLVKISQKLRKNISGSKIKDVLEKLKKCPAGPDTDLIKALKFGVAFHHAGLTSEEREIIEDAFKLGAIKTLMATSTLSSGVNLPARRVVIRSPTMISTNSGSFQKEMLSPISYRQMIGRAGRKGIDTFGESILICRPDNQDTALKLLASTLGDINSSLANRLLASGGEPSGLKKAVLEVIANGTAMTRAHLNRYLQSTFWLQSSSLSILERINEFKTAMTETLKSLTSKKFIEELKPGVYKPTRLGNAVLNSGIHPDESLELLQDLMKARHGFCLLNDLHIIYQVTPNDLARAIELKDWQHYSKIWNNLDDICQYVGQRVGVDEIVVARRAQGFVSSLNEEKERVYRRFWIALIINDLVSEMQLQEICKKYRMSKATVQQAQRAVAQFAGVISIFCNELGYDNIAALVTPLESRINFSCQRDLLDLIRLNITRPIARSLYNAGYKNIIAVAKGDALEIEFIIRQLQPFKKEQSFSEHESPSMWVPELARTMSTLDYASHIIEAARSYVEIEYEIDVTSMIAKKREEDCSTQANESLESRPSPAKRERRGSETENFSERGDAIIVPQGEIMMSEETPNFVVKYVGQGYSDVRNFIDKWTRHSCISLNFKLEQQINESIGAKILSTSSNRTKARRRASASRRSSSNNLDLTSDEDDDEQVPSQKGLPLRLDIDNKKHIVTKMYTCFDDEMIVYIIDSNIALKQVRDNLKQKLVNTLSSSSVGSNSHINTIKLFTQNIISTYKVLYAAFHFDQATLMKIFEWHSFDVAWWMINNCPNRGLNNCNSSLSLVAKTKWALKYHHFLHPSSRGSRCLQRSNVQILTNELVPATGEDKLGRSIDDFQRLKDIVKSGKTAILKPLINELLDELRVREQLSAYHDSELISRLVLAQVMIHGIGLDMQSIKDEITLYEDLSDQLTNIAKRYYSKSDISLTNNRHVARVLYEDLDLRRHLLDHKTISDITKDPTNMEILNILSEHHPFPKLVQDFRKIGKALDALQSASTHARYNTELYMMRVFGHCDFWQLTGRVSMSDPDLFLINRNFSVTIPQHGKRPREDIDCAPRRCFIPMPGWVFIAADYSQLELRLLAHFSNDSNLLEILNRSLSSDQTFDVFKTVASRIHRKPIEQITTENRQHAKQICYGIIYGMGNTSLANHLGVDVQQAELFREDFFSAFPQIQSFIDDLIDCCMDKGFVTSLLGRRRLISGLKSEQPSERSRARRVAVNTKIQSSASDIIKLAMKLVNQQLIENFHSDARLCLEMHDELIYEVNPDVSQRFADILQNTMENLGDVMKLQVKLLVNLKKGTNWSNFETFNRT